MRDLLVSATVMLSVPLILWRPYIGALMWVWISMMNPHRLAYGWAYTFPFAQVIAITTLVAVVASGKLKRFPANAITMLMLAFVAWMCVTSLLALQQPEVLWSALVQVLKTQLMLLVTMMIIRGRRQIDLLIWTIVISVGYFGVKGGIFTVLTGGQNRVWGPPSSWIEGNNELGLALAMLIPLMYYLAEMTTRRWVRYGMWFAIVACAFSVLGTQSRGAFLAVGVAAVVLGMKSRRPVLMTTVLAIGLAAAIAFMPDKWTQRMETIESFRQDTSAVSRLQTWETIWTMVKDRPVFGAGFDLANPALYQMYAPSANYEVFAPHSIYFQALGEHGFPGLALVLALGFLIWRRSGRLAAACAGMPEFEWVSLLMRMVQVSLVVFAVGGAFLGLLHYDLPYYLAALVVLVEVAVKEALQTNPMARVTQAGAVAVRAEGGRV
jgi:putative inorganic carbon (hco3(-)) transporter